jgi:hypothetical protein
MRFNMHILQTKYQQLKTEFEALGLLLEPAKTELMHFAAHDLTKPGKPLYSGSYPEMDLGVEPFTGDKRLKPSKLWRYLGFFFDSKLSFSYHIDYYVNKAYSMIKALHMLGNLVKGLDFQNRTKIYKVSLLQQSSLNSYHYLPIREPITTCHISTNSTPPMSSTHPRKGKKRLPPQTPTG